MKERVTDSRSCERSLMRPRSVVQGLLAARERLAHARSRHVPGPAVASARVRICSLVVLGECAAALFEVLGEFQRLLDGAGGDAAQRVDLIGHLVGGAARLGGDLGEEGFDVLDASGKAVLDRAEIAAGGGRDLLEQLVGVLQTAEHVGELAAQMVVGAGEGHRRSARCPRRWPRAWLRVDCMYRTAVSSMRALLRSSSSMESCDPAGCRSRRCCAVPGRGWWFR